MFATSRPTLVRQVSSADETTFEHANRVLELAVTMRQALASRTHDRRWRNLRVYKQCFLHSDAVEWMVGHLPLVSSNAAPENTHASDQRDAEVKAVALLNEVLDAGYVHHVCNEHRFTVNEGAALYFRFQNDAIEADRKSIRRRREVLGELYGGVATILQEETASLKMAVERLTATAEKYSHQLDDAHGRILVLEEAIASLSFAAGVVIYLAAAIALRGAIVSGGSGIGHTVLVGVYSTTIALLTANWSLRGPNNIFSVMLEHITVLLKLMRLSTDLEEAFIEVEKEVDSVSSTSIDEPLTLQAVTKRQDSSVVERVRSILSGQSLRVIPASIRMREASTLPHISEWPHQPIFVCANSDAQPDLAIPKFGQGACPLGIPFEFSSDLFEGTCLIRLKNVPSDDPNADEEYFFGRRRRFQAIVQGRFKEELKVDEVLTGHEFVRPLKRLPPSWVVHAGVNLIRRLAPGADIVLHDKQPRALAILAATSQTISADMPGNEPDITSNEIREDVSLFGRFFKNGDVTAARRKRHLAAPTRAARYKFDTESVYTFDFYQNLLDTATYSLDLGFTKFGLHRSLDGQPIQVLSKAVDGRYLWSFQIWHEMLLPKEKRKVD